MQSKDDLNKIKKAQSYIRSKIRFDIHVNNYNVAPPIQAPLVNLPGPYQVTLRMRLQKIIDELSEKQAIINSKKLNHFTVISNLQSIIRTNYMLGNQTLTREKISFTGNALTMADKTDQDTVCFAPARVDSLTFISDKSDLNSPKKIFKKNLCSIVCDLSKLNYPGTNQFFKITDFTNSVSFYQDFVINERVSVNIYRQAGIFGPRREFTFSIKFDGQEHSFPFKTEELFFYGHAEDINRFCLTRLFDCINADSYKNSTFSRDKFLNYLQTLNDDEIKKILILCGQSLTHYSEYNIHSYCCLNDVRINEIRLYDQKIKYEVQQLESSEYQAFLEHFANSEWDAPLLKQCELPLKEINDLNKHRDLSYSDNRTTDFSKYPASFFSSNKYIETREYVNNTDDLIKPYSPQTI